MKKQTIKLTTQEKKAVEALKHTTKLTPWGLKVYQIVRSASCEDIRALIKELQTEGLANPDMMDRILGKDEEGNSVFDAVLEVDYDEAVCDDEETESMIQLSQKASL